MNTTMKTYTKESRDFKICISRMYLEDGMSVQRLSDIFHIPRPTIYAWSKQYRTYGDMAFVGCGNRIQSELAMCRLREENARLRKEIAEKKTLAVS